MNQQQGSVFPTLQIIVGAFVMSLVMFTGVAYVVTQGVEPNPDAESMAQILAIVGVIPLGASSFVQRFLLEQTHRRLTQSGGSDAQWGQGYMVPMIVGSAMREATGIFGFVTTFLTGNMLWVTAYAAIAAIGIGLSFPTPDRFHSWRQRRM